MFQNQNIYCLMNLKTLLSLPVLVRRLPVTLMSAKLNSPVFDGVNIVSDQPKVEAQACDLSLQVCFDEEPISLTIDIIKITRVVNLPLEFRNWDRSIVTT